jgi:hypothetical protein
MFGQVKAILLCSHSVLFCSEAVPKKVGFGFLKWGREFHPTPTHEHIS